MRVAFLCLFLLALLTGCIADTGTISATIETDQAALELQERLNVTVTFENTSLTDHTYDHPGCPPDLVRVWVETSEGPVGLYPYGKEPVAGTCAVEERTLAAGETLEVTVNWNGRTNPDPAGPHEGPPVAAGEHRIVAELARADDGPPFQQEATVQVTG